MDVLHWSLKRSLGRPMLRVTSDSFLYSICFGILEISMCAVCPSPQTVPYTVSVWEFWRYPCAQRVQALRQFPIQYPFGNSGDIHVHSVSKPSDSSLYSICLGILEISMYTVCPSPQTVPYTVSVWEFWRYPCAQRVQALRQFPIQYLFGNSGDIHVHSVSRPPEMLRPQDGI